MAYKLKTLTEKSWLIISDIESERIGLLTEIRNNYILMAAGIKRQFLDKKAVNEFFNEDLFSSIVDCPAELQIEKAHFINGYSVDVDNPLEVFITGNKLPLFSKKDTSNVYYCAGYYCINFPKNWVLTFCPKLSTIEKHGYVGPFKTTYDAKSTLTELRKNKREGICSK